MKLKIFVVAFFTKRLYKNVIIIKSWLKLNQNNHRLLWKIHRVIKLIDMIQNFILTLNIPSEMLWVWRAFHQSRDNQIYIVNTKELKIGELISPFDSL